MCVKVGPSGLVPVSLSVNYTKGKARVEASLSFRLLTRPPAEIGEDEQRLIDQIDVQFLVQNCHYAQRSPRLSQTPFSSLLTFVSSRAIRELSTVPPTEKRQRTSAKRHRRVKKASEERTREKTVKQTQHCFSSFSSSRSSELVQTPSGLDARTTTSGLYENPGLTQEEAAKDEEERGREKQEKGEKDSALSLSSSSLYFPSGNSFGLSSSSSSSSSSSYASSLAGVDERVVGEWEEVLGKMECHSFLSAEIGSVQFFSSSPLPFTSFPFSHSSPVPFPFSLPFHSPSQ